MKGKSIKNKTNTTLLLVIIASAIIVGYFATMTGMFSIYLGSASSYRFVYINTYNFPNMTQQSSAVSYTYSYKDSGTKQKLKTLSGSCNTNIELFNIGSFVNEMDGGLLNGTQAINGKYSYPSQQNVNIALCLLRLPVSQYNSTSGTITLSARGNNGAKTQESYIMSIDVQSQYAGQRSGGSYQAYPVLITLPLLNINNVSLVSNTTSLNNTTTQSSTSTTTIPPTTKNTTTTTKSSTTTTIIPTTNNTNSTTTPNNPPPFSFNNFIQSIINFFSNLGRYFSV